MAEGPAIEEGLLFDDGSYRHQLIASPPDESMRRDSDVYEGSDECHDRLWLSAAHSEDKCGIALPAQRQSPIRRTNNSSSRRKQNMHRLKLGQYALQDTRLLWSPALNDFTRKLRLYRAAMIVSDTPSIVEVLGCGVNGRVFSEGANTGKLIFIEVYSIWNAVKYSIILNGIEIKTLFAKQSHLFKNGKKKELAVALCRHIYFEYQIAFRAPDTIDAAAAVTVAVPDAEDSEYSLLHATTVTATAAPPLALQSLVHLDKPPAMPEGYPQTLSKIRDFLIGPTRSTLPDLTLTQTLLISDVDRKDWQSGSSARLERAKLFGVEEKEWLAQYMRERDEEEAAWSSQPKRRRGLRGRRVVRSDGRIAMLSAYVDRKNTNVCILGLLPGQCVRLSLNLSLASVAGMTGIRVPSSKWTHEFVGYFLVQALRRVRIFRRVVQRERGVADTTYCLGLPAGDDATACGDDVKLPPLSAVQQGRGGDRTSTVYLASAHYSSLDRCFANRRRVFFKPRRDIGKGLRLLSRSKKIDHVYCVYSVYVETRDLHRGKAPEWNGTLPYPVDSSMGANIRPRTNEAVAAAAAAGDHDDKYEYGNDDNEDRSDYNNYGDGGGDSLPNEFGVSTHTGSLFDDINDFSASAASSVDPTEDVCNFLTSLCPGDFRLHMELYVPCGASVYCYPLQQASVYKVSFTKFDIARVVKDKLLFFYVLRAMYEDFWSSPTDGDLQSMQLAWERFCDDLLDQARWRLLFETAAVRSGDDPPRSDDIQSKIYYAESQCYYNFKSDADEQAPPAVNIWPPVPCVVLSWPSTVVRKTCRFQSACPGVVNPQLQLTLAAKGENLYIVVYDLARPDIYFARPGWELQKGHSQKLVFMRKFDQVFDTATWLSTALVYSEVRDAGSGESHGQMTFMDMDMDMDMPDDLVADDYGDVAAQLMEAAEAKAKERNERSLRSGEKIRSMTPDSRISSPAAGRRGDIGSSAVLDSDLNGDGDEDD